MRTDYRSVIAYKAKLAQRIRNLNPTLANDLTDVKLPWYYIRNAEGSPAEDPDEDEELEELGAEIFIYDEIGGSFGVSADEFVQDLQGVTAKNICVRINSPGGSVFDAVAIYNALIQHPANITTRVDALAASAASIIAMAGDRVEMMIGSQLMIHDALGLEMGNAADMREMATFLDRQSDNLASIYANKGGTEQDWRALMLAETWMFADEAVAFGLADSVYTRAVKRELPEDAEGDKPEEPIPGEDDEDAPEEEPKEDDEEAKALNLLMAKRHSLVNRKYKYPGRSKAPKPKARATRAVRHSDSTPDYVTDYLSKLERNANA